MNYDESIYKEKANRRARKIWLVLRHFTISQLRL